MGCFSGVGEKKLERYADAFLAAIRQHAFQHHYPHVHIRYHEFKAVFRIPGGELLEGELPGRQMKLVQAWIELHQDDLMANWYLASTGQTPFKIDPLR
jgi:hypothetical protein